MVVYILKSQNYEKTYVGMTDNIERRLKQHNACQHTYTKRYAPWTVVYTEEQENREVARIKERYLKSAAGRRWIAKTIFNK